MLPQRFLAGVVIVAFAARLVALWDAPRFQFEDLSKVRANVLAAASGNRKLQLDSVKEVRWQRFDPLARVRLLPGPDQFPGGAGIDDNANGVVDDAGELGATHSDDLCVVEASGDPPSNIKPSVVLQRGAYVSASLDELYPVHSQTPPSVMRNENAPISDPAAQSRSPQTRSPRTRSPRAVVFGQHGDQTWSILIDLPDAHSRTASSK